MRFKEPLGDMGRKKRAGQPALFVYHLPMRRIVLSLVLLLIAIPSISATRTIEGKVVSVADGDTITVLDSDKVQHRVRLAGIDAPEKSQPFGNASKKRLSELVGGKDVRVEFEKYDRYGRIVGKGVGDSARLSLLRQDAGRRPRTDHIGDGVVV